MAKGEPKRFTMVRVGGKRCVQVPLLAFIILVFFAALMTALLWSSKRRVDTRLAVKDPGELMTMIPSIVGVTHFGSLLERGVRIWEYDKTLLHQKVMVVDGLWSCVGSTNFDARSFEINDEISIGVIDRRIAEELRAAFFEDMKHSRERKLDEWTNRSLWHKLQDGLAYLAHDQM